jgi:GTP 3',8-cyclase
MDVIYAMPGQPHRLFVNVIHACPNACYFCVDFKGDSFFGFNLSKGRAPTCEEMVSAVKSFPHRAQVRELYFCGIGEPMLQYDRVVEAATRIRSLLPAGALMALNTSGMFYLADPRLDFAEHFDLIQISLNAENEAKYDEICRPKVRGAYQVLMRFLKDLREFISRSGSTCRVELTVVDVAAREHLPERERAMPSPPTPDIAACRRIADKFGWPLKVKPLIVASELGAWDPFAQEYRP